ncbi:MAG: hypothetical protein Q9222_001829 [Ikaeria aurantiellina]
MPPRSTPVRGAKNKPKLGASWVVEDGSDSSDQSTSEGVQIKKDVRQSHEDPTPELPQRRTPRARIKESAGPQLIMPSLNESSLDGSRLIGEDSRILASSRKRNKRRAPNGQSSNSGASATMTEGACKGREKPSEIHRDNAGRILMDIVQPIFGWLYDILGGAMGKIKTPLSYFLAMYLLVGLVLLLRNLVTSSVYSALSPICRIPGTSLLNLPMCHNTLSPQHQYKAGEEPPVEFDQLMNVQNHFEAILEESAGGVTLPLDMKRSETSLRDLRSIIRYSGLHSKNELVFEFNGFIETASIASSALQKFNSHVGRAVDNILATARWTKRVLDGVATEHESRGLVSAFLNDRILFPFQPLRFTAPAILEQYTEHTRLVESEINRLIDEAQALLVVLRNLDDRLDVIHGIAIRDDLHVQGSKEEIMSHLWTMLGGNRKQLGKFDSQIKLLSQVNMYRQTAIAHVAGTMLKLQAMGAELEELRERVGSVDLIDEKRGVPLTVHIESIELGVERLEQRRNWARGVENEQMQKALAKGPSGDQRKEIGGR